MSNEITALAAQANEQHGLAEAKAQEAIGHALEAGRLLVEAKTQVEHGGWADWLTANFNGSKRTARAYMRLANNWQTIEAKWQTSADLSIDGALRLLTEPKQEAKPEPVRLPDSESIRRWPEMSDGYARLRIEEGQTFTQVAYDLGVSADMMRRRFDPKPPRRTRGEIPAALFELYANEIDTDICFHHYQAYDRAARQAEREGSPLLDRMRTLSDHYYRMYQRRRGEPNLLGLAVARDGSVTGRAFALCLYMAAMRDFREAIGLEDESGHLMLVFHALDCLDMDEAEQIVREHK